MRLLFLAVVILASLSSPAQAESPGFTALNQCKNQSKDHVQKVSCLADHAETLKQKLANAVTVAKAESRELEDIAKSSDTAAYQDLTAQIEKAQALFESYMSAHCDWRRANYGTGTFGGDAYFICLIDLTQQRIDALKQY